MRRYLIAGNWKMNKLTSEAEAIVNELKRSLPAKKNVDVLVCPTYTSLHPVKAALEGSNILIGAQDVFWKESGAYTSQISPSMLKDVGVSYVIIGHSETRGRFGVPEPDFDETILRHFGESDETVNRKAKAALSAGLIPIICVGETLSERKEGISDGLIADQVEKALDGISGEDVAKLVFAYEPVWAIGTGETCEADEADRICHLIRTTIEGFFGSTVSERVRIQYGGSMKPSNAKELLAKPNIDGGLIGGASLKAGDFTAIVDAAE